MLPRTGGEALEDRVVAECGLTPQYEAWSACIGSATRRCCFMQGGRGRRMGAVGLGCAFFDGFAVPVDGAGAPAGRRGMEGDLPVGVLAQPPAALVHKPVAIFTDRGPVRHAGGPAVGPEDHMVDHGRPRAAPLSAAPPAVPGI